MKSSVTLPFVKTVNTPSRIIYAFAFHVRGAIAQLPFAQVTPRMHAKPRNSFSFDVMADTQWLDQPGGANTVATGIIHSSNQGLRNAATQDRGCFADAANARDNDGQLLKQNEEAR
jgi:hypothetical protein